MDLNLRNILLSKDNTIKIIADLSIATSDVPYDTHTTGRGTLEYRTHKLEGKDYGNHVEIFNLGNT